VLFSYHLGCATTVLYCGCVTVVLWKWLVAVRGSLTCTEKMSALSYHLGLRHFHECHEVHALGSPPRPAESCTRNGKGTPHHLLLMLLLLLLLLLLLRLLSLLLLLLLLLVKIPLSSFHICSFSCCTYS